MAQFCPSLTGSPCFSIAQLNLQEEEFASLITWEGDRTHTTPSFIPLSPLSQSNPRSKVPSPEVSSPSIQDICDRTLTDVMFSSVRSEIEAIEFPVWR